MAKAKKVAKAPAMKTTVSAGKAPAKDSGYASKTPSKSGYGSAAPAKSGAKLTGKAKTPRKAAKK